MASSHVLPSGQTVALGRPTASPHKPSDLHIASFLRAPAALPTPPATLDYAQEVQQPWPMFANDRIGDCVFASSGHARLSQAARVGRQVRIAPQTVVNAYAAATGYVPRTGAHDDGAVEVDALGYFRHHQFAGDRLFAYARVDPQNDALLDLCQFLFGGVWWGIGLPLSAQPQSGPGLLWDVVDGGRGASGAAYSWGGHAVWSPGWYDPERVGIVTWGAFQFMSRAFIKTYADEAWVRLPAAWRQHDPFAALDWTALIAAVARFGPVNPVGGAG